MEAFALGNEKSLGIFYKDQNVFSDHNDQQCVVVTVYMYSLHESITIGHY